MTTTIRIGGRDYAVEQVTGARGEVAYVLRGVRGAIYMTMRNRPNPSLMFLVSGRKFGPASVMDGIWLTDATGTLEVA